MLPIERVQVHSRGSAQPGDLLLRRLRGKSFPIFIALVEGAKVFIPLGSDSPFCAYQSTNAESRYLTAGTASFSVDLESAYSAMDNMRSRGQLFVADGQRGFIASLDGATIYVGLDGSQLPEPAWPNFSGFTRWSVSVPGDENEMLEIYNAGR